MGSSTPGVGAAAPGDSATDVGGASGTKVGSASQAVAFAQAQVDHPSQDWYEKCQSFVRQALGFSQGTAPTAQAAWNDTESTGGTVHKGDYNPPAGVPVYWSGGSSGNGHVALSAGQGYVYSTDINGRGTVALVPIMSIQQKWGLNYLGWAETEAGSGKLYGGSSGGTSGFGGSIPNVGGGIVDAASAALNPLGSLVSWLQGGVIRVAYFLGGAVLLIFFLWKAGGS